MSVLQISPLTVQSLFPLGQAVALLPPEPDCWEPEHKPVEL